VGNKKVTRDIRKDSITCRDNNGNMGNIFVTRDIKKDSITCGDNTENMGYKNVTCNKRALLPQQQRYFPEIHGLQKCNP
jgi:hypothetical protein